MHKHTRWLLTEIDRWQAEGIVSAEQVARLRARYAEKTAGPPWGLIVFASAGAVVIGLGVILLFAYNWDDIPKFGKLALVFGAIIASHAGGLVLSRKSGWQPKLGEALSLLGTMFFGAGIWLVAQVYHIDEHFPSGFLFWALGALALAWALESIPQALLAAVLFTIWGCAEAWGFDQPTYWAIPALLLGLGPLAWRKQSALLGAALLAGAYFLSAATLGSYGGGAHAFTFCLALSVLLLGAEIALRGADGRPAPGTAVWRFFGFSGFLLCAYLLGFHKLADGLLDWDGPSGSDHLVAAIYAWAMLAAAMLCWLGVLWRAFRKKNVVVLVEEWLCPIALAYAYLLAVRRGHVEDLFVALVFNVILLGIAIMWMFRGCREALLRSTVLGSVLLAALVWARYFDLFESQASRGITFLLLGGVLMAEALYYRRNRREEAADAGGAP